MFFLNTFHWEWMRTIGSRTREFCLFTPSGWRSLCILGNTERYIYDPSTGQATNDETGGWLRQSVYCETVHTQITQYIMHEDGFKRPSAPFRPACIRDGGGDWRVGCRGRLQIGPQQAVGKASALGGVFRLFFTAWARMRL